MNNNKITISVSNRTGRKFHTFVYGFDDDIDLPKILRHFKKTFNCTGSIEKNDNFGEVIKLTGDQKKLAIAFLITEKICKVEDIILKGL
jgi:translation initiation factor 1